MSQQIRLRLSELEQLRADLDALPAQQPSSISRRQAVRLLAPVIEQLLARGYNLADVAQQLSDRGLAVTPVVLKSYLSDARRESAGAIAGKSPPSRSKRTSKAKRSPVAGRATQVRESRVDGENQAAPASEHVHVAPAAVPEAHKEEKTRELPVAANDRVSNASNQQDARARKSLFSVTEDTSEI